MTSIGERAAKAIWDRVAQRGIGLKEELQKLDVPYATFHNWEKRNLSPRAYFLGQMALNGYDIMWILTGGEGNG